MIRLNGLWPCVMLLWATSPTLVHAQAAGGGGGAFLQRINGILDGLNLTAGEKSKIDDVLHDAHEDGAKLRSEVADLSPEERQEKVRDFVSGLRKKIDAQLTPEQAKEFDAKMADGAENAAGNTPATQPSAARPGLAGRRGGGAGGRFEQFRSAIDKLDLTTDQKSKIHAMFEELKPQMTALRDADPQDRREKAMSLMSDMRSKLADILTPGQLQSLRESMQGGGKAAATTQPTAAKAPTAMMMNGDDAGMQMTAAANAPAAKPAAGAAKSSPTGYAVGQTPTNFKLARLDQSPVNLSVYKGRVVALVFGSYSNPMFRDHAEDLNKLSEKLTSDAAVVLVYTRESNPEGGWQTHRNKQANVSVKQTSTIAERSTAAQMTRDALHLIVPIVVDDNNDTLANAFGVLPNGCVVLNRTGAVSAKFHWFEPVSARHAIDEALASPVVMTTPASPADLR